MAAWRAIVRPLRIKRHGTVSCAQRHACRIAMLHNPQLMEDIMRNLYWLTEAQMQRLRPYFPESRGHARVTDLRVLSSIIFIYRNRVHVVSGRWPDATSSGRFRA
jgi:hypothetical protein